MVADASVVADLSGQLGYPVAVDAVAERLAHILARDQEVVLVACDDADVVVGWTHGAEQHLIEENPRCEILGLVVDRRCRRQGVGQRLVAALEEWAAARGLHAMSVRSNIVRRESHPFYERAGYERKKTQHVYRKSISGSSSR